MTTEKNGAPETTAPAAANLENVALADSELEKVAGGHSVVNVAPETGKKLAASAQIGELKENGAADNNLVQFQSQPR